MITVEVYSKSHGFGSPVATLSYSGRGKTVKIQSESAEIKQELTNFSEMVLGLTGQRLAFPTNRQRWMESLPLIDAPVPYWFKIANSESEIIEEVDDDNEEANGEEEPADRGDATGDGDGSDDGGESVSNDGGSTDGGYDNHNG